MPNYIPREILDNVLKMLICTQEIKLTNIHQQWALKTIPNLKSLLISGFQQFFRLDPFLTKDFMLNITKKRVAENRVNDAC